MDITICGKELRAVIDTYGGKLVGLSRPDGGEYVWQETYCYWPDRAGVLFPTCGRVFGEEMTYRGKRMRMPLHGFAYTSEMKVLSRTDTSVTLGMDGDGSGDMYPFPYSLSVTYAIDGSRLDVTAEVRNTGSGDMYYALGFHPWFNVPVERGRAFEEYSVAFPGAGDVRRCVMSAGVLDTGVREPYPLIGSKLPLRHSLFDDDALMLAGTGGTAVISRGSGDEIVFRYEGMPYIGMWHLEKKEVPFLCLEPMTALPGREGVTEDWSTRPGVTMLPAGGSRRTGISVEIRRGR